MINKYLKSIKIIFFFASICFSIILVYFIVILVIQGIFASFALMGLLFSCIIINLVIIIPKPPKLLRILSFQEEKLTLIDIDSWDGQAIRISNEFYKKVLKEKVIPEDLDNEIRNRLFGTTHRLKDGIYLLQGKNHNKRKDLIYFGETSDLKHRMYEHNKNFNCDWGDYIFYFTNSKENFGPTIRRKAEIMLIRKAKRNKNLIVKNT